MAAVGRAAVHSGRRRPQGLCPTGVGAHQECVVAHSLPGAVSSCGVWQGCARWGRSASVGGVVPATHHGAWDGPKQARVTGRRSIWPDSETSLILPTIKVERLRQDGPFRVGATYGAAEGQTDKDFSASSSA